MSGHDLYQDISDLPNVLPLFPLPAALLLPYGQLPLNIFEPRYLAMTKNAMSSDRIIGMIQPADQAAAIAIDDARAKPLLQTIGCAGRITSFAETGGDRTGDGRTDGGRILITLTGICRFAVIKELDSLYPYRLAQVDFDPYSHDLDETHGESDVDRQKLLAVFRGFIKAENLSIDWKAINAASTMALVNGLSMASPYGMSEKQALLEAGDLKARAETLIALTEMTLKENASTHTPTLQ